MEDQVSERRVRACLHCSQRKVGCMIGVDVMAPCQRCVRFGLACTPFVDGRGRNDSSEMRAQLQRLETVLHTLKRHRSSSLAASTASPATTPRSNAASTSSERQNIGVEDLIGQLTQLCLRSEALNGPIASADPNELLAEARKILREADMTRIDRLASGGFVYRLPQSTQSFASLQEVIAQLPPWPHTRLMLDTYTSRWWHQADILFTPFWPEQVQAAFESNFRPLPSPHFVAELFGVLAVTKQCLSVERGHLTEAVAVLQKEADLYLACLESALDIGDYIDQPSLQAIRALFLLSSKTMSKLKRGLTVLSVAVSLINELNLAGPEADYVGCEDPVTAYERRAVVTAVARFDWTYNVAFGRKSHCSSLTMLASPPDYLRSEQLPAHLHRSAWRASALGIHSAHIRHHIARMQHEMLVDLYPSSKSVNYSRVRHHADRLAAYERDIIPPSWLSVEDAITGDWKWQTQPTSYAERVIRVWVLAKFANVALYLHRPFVGTKCDEAVDTDWHQRELLRWSRRLWGVFSEAASLAGPFLSLMASLWHSILGICLLLFLDPDNEEAQRCRLDLSSIVSDLSTMPAAPPAVEKLARLCRFLLDRPRLRQANVGATQKRARRGQIDDGHSDFRSPFSPPFHQDSPRSAHGFFTFAVSTPELSNAFNALETTQIPQILQEPKRKPSFNTHGPSRASALPLGLPASSSTTRTDRSTVPQQSSSGSSSAAPDFEDVTFTWLQERMVGSSSLASALTGLQTIATGSSSFDAWLAEELNQ